MSKALLHDAVYRSSENKSEGYSMHPQVDSGHGFTCDEGILDYIQAIWRIGFQTTYSCQSTITMVGAKESIGIISIDDNRELSDTPRAVIGITHPDPHKLLDFLLYVRENMQSTIGWRAKLGVDKYGSEFHPFPIVNLIFHESVRNDSLMIIEKYEGVDDIEDDLEGEEE